MRSRIHSVVLSSEAGECTPAVDVHETDATVEIVMDLPGGEPSAVRVVFKGNAVLIAAARNGAQARAVLSDGELRIPVPKVVERRGRAIQVTVESAAKPS